jgi:hypothetical protein
MYTSFIAYCFVINQFLGGWWVQGVRFYAGTRRPVSDHHGSLFFKCVRVCVCVCLAEKFSERAREREREKERVHLIRFSRL